MHFRIHSNPSPASSSDCRLGWECYFVPASTCTQWSVGGPERGATVPLSHETEDQPVVTIGFTQGLGRCSPGGGEGVGVVTDQDQNIYMPPKYRHRGLLWFRSQLARFLFRPNRRAMAHIAAVQAKIGWPGLGAIPAGEEVVGLHVRRGDKLMGIDGYQTKYLSLNDFLDQGEWLARGVPNFFLSTDDPDVVLEARDIEEAGSTVATGAPLRFLVDESEPRHNGTGTRLSRPGVLWIAALHCSAENVPNTTRCALDAIASVWLLSQCSALVGTFSSNLARLAYELAAARLGPQPPADGAPPPVAGAAAGGFRPAARAASLDRSEKAGDFSIDQCAAPPCVPLWFPGP
mmetsp:Transcript_68623/g.183144  ORF Transcript_68623/g.183144 Transcript_68623/m.183144 type:complete len:347 (+) Transcript_68623:55-1095(+)